MRQNIIDVIKFNQSILDFLHEPNTKMAVYEAVGDNRNFGTFIDYFDQLKRGGYFEEMGKVSCGTKSARKVFKTIKPTFVHISSTEVKDTTVYPDYVHPYHFETDKRLQEKYKKLSQLYRSEMRSPKNYASGATMSQF
jgi:hypothetical protein